MAMKGGISARRATFSTAVCLLPQQHHAKPIAAGIGFSLAAGRISRTLGTEDSLHTAEDIGLLQVVALALQGLQNRLVGIGLVEDDIRCAVMMKPAGGDRLVERAPVDEGI